MAFAHSSMTHQFQQIMQDLLYDQVPQDGALALFLRRTLGSSSAYFPISLAAGSALENPGPILRHHYLYSLDYAATNDDESQLLDDAVGIEPLIRMGKLAAMLFPNGPIALDIHVCDTDTRNILLCGFRQYSDTPARPPTMFFRGACAALVAQWQQIARSQLRFDAGTHDTIAEGVADLVSDQSPEPPYFPYLHVRLASRSRRHAKAQLGNWKVNALSYNCFLVDKKPTLSSYVREMFISRKLAYVDDSIKSADPVVAAIVSVCDDFVHRIGLHPDTGTLVYARRNIAKHSLLGNPDHHPCVLRNARTHSSLWSLLRSSLSYLQDDTEHGDSALITCWAGRAGEDGEVAAIPVGFVPGGRTDLLGDVASSPRLAERLPSPKKRLEATVVLPTPVAPRKPQDQFSDPFLSRILAEAERAIPGAVWEAKYPGPYKLIIESWGVRIIEKATGIEAKPVYCKESNGQLTWLLLHALATGGEERAVTYDELRDRIKEINKRASSDYRRVTELVTACLKAHGIDPDLVFKYVKRGKLWKLECSKDDVTVKRSMESQRAQQEGVVNGRDVARQASAAYMRAQGKQAVDELKLLAGWSELSDLHRRVVRSYHDNLGSEERRDWCLDHNMSIDTFDKALAEALDILEKSAGHVKGQTR